ncbi:MAG: hypothetical protein M1820_005508 [Bogoriella megaspora]|nr:MAG: hypothetical protein M1820_005508 [Bogoriella megaspora]
MAIMTNSNLKRNSSSSSSTTSRSSSSTVSSSKIAATAYTVSASTLTLTTLHFSTGGAGGVGCTSPSSLSTNLNKDERRRRGAMGDAAYAVTEECERLFCGTLRAVFLGERQEGRRVAGVRDDEALRDHAGIGRGRVTDVAAETKKEFRARREINARQNGAVTGLQVQDIAEERGAVRDWVEVFDYRGDVSFRGCVVEDDDGERSFVVFFSHGVVGKELKHGLIAALDRSILPPESERLKRALGWVGFRPTTLKAWAGEDVVSEEWLFLSMDV